MQLLVSVANAAEASAALEGGADVIDAKNPHAGPLGAVSMAVLHDIHRVVAGAQPVSAALGDADDEGTIEGDAQAFVAAGAQFVKVGFGTIATRERIAALTVAAVRGAARGAALFSARATTGCGGVIVVAYADTVSTPARLALLEVAAHAGAAGVLLDTADKSGPGLRELVAPAELAAWIATAHDARLMVAVAGKLTADDLLFVRDAGADIAGVRGAACENGRTGQLTADRVRLLKARLS